MTKRVIVSLIAALALVLTATASAAISITQAPAGPGYQNLSPYNCDGKTFYLTPHYFDPDPNTGIANQIPGSGLPIRLGFGWGAQTQQNMVQFFQNESGTVSITGTDTLSDSWGKTSGNPPTSLDGITWSPVAPNPLTRPDGTTVSGYASFYRGVLSIAPGSYTLSVNIVLAHPVNDGFGTYKGTLPGTCSFTVVS
jgi:hypothetical protein